MPEITRRPTPRQTEALRTGAADDKGIIEVGADKRTHEGLVGRGMADWVQRETLGMNRWGSPLCVITAAGRAYLAKLDGGVKAAREASEAAGVSIEGVTREDVTEGARKALAWLGYGEQRRKAESAPAAKVLSVEFARTRVVMRRAMKSAPAGAASQALDRYNRAQQLLTAARHFATLDAAARLAETAPRITATLGAPRPAFTAPTTTEETMTDTAPAADSHEGRLAELRALRAVTEGVINAGHDAQYVPAHSIYNQYLAGRYSRGMLATRAYWVNADNGAAEVERTSTTAQARAYASAFKALDRITVGPHACTLVFADGTTESLISYDTVCILPAA